MHSRRPENILIGARFLRSQSVNVCFARMDQSRSETAFGVVYISKVVYYVGNYLPRHAPSTIARAVRASAHRTSFSTISVSDHHDAIFLDYYCTSQCISRVTDKEIFVVSLPSLLNCTPRIRSKI